MLEKRGARLFDIPVFFLLTYVPNYMGGWAKALIEILFFSSCISLSCCFVDFLSTFWLSLYYDTSTHYRGSHTHTHT